MLQTLLDSCAALGVPLTAAQAEQLCAFGARLLEQNRVMNLTAITEPQAVAKLHFADCLALLRIVPFAKKRVIDVGCGAGFPGVPLKLGEPSLDLTAARQPRQARDVAGGNAAGHGRPGAVRLRPCGGLCREGARAI